MGVVIIEQEENFWKVYTKKKKKFYSDIDRMLEDLRRDLQRRR